MFLKPRQYGVRPLAFLKSRSDGCLSEAASFQRLAAFTADYNEFYCCKPRTWRHHRTAASRQQRARTFAVSFCLYSTLKWAQEGLKITIFILLSPVGVGEAIFLKAKPIFHLCAGSARGIQRRPLGPCLGRVRGMRSLNRISTDTLWKEPCLPNRVT